MCESELESQIERDLRLQEQLRGAGFDSGDPSRKRGLDDVEEEPAPPQWQWVPNRISATVWTTYVDTFVKCSAGRWAVGALLPSWIMGTSFLLLWQQNGGPRGACLVILYSGNPLFAQHDILLVIFDPKGQFCSMKSSVIVTLLSCPNSVTNPIVTVLCIVINC